MDHHIQIEQLDDDNQLPYSAYGIEDSIESEQETNINKHNRLSTASTLIGGTNPLRQQQGLPYPPTSSHSQLFDIKTTPAKRGQKSICQSEKCQKGNLYRFFHSEAGRLVCAFIYFFVVCIGMAFCNQLSDNRWVQTDYTKVLLSDRGFDVIPAQADIQPANTFVMTSVLFTVLGIGFICPNWTTRAMVIRRIMWIIGTLSAYRSLTLSVTTLPTPKEECRPSLKTGFWDMLIIAFQMIPGTVEACTDDIFSGHSVFMVTCAIQWRLYCKNKWITYIAYLYISVGLYYVVATRLHYSVDVVLAIFITYAVWSIYINMIDTVMEEEYFGIKSTHEKYAYFDSSVVEYKFSQDESSECTETEGEEELCSTGNPSINQRRRQLEHAMNRVRGPGIGYGRGEFDNVAFVPMQFNTGLKSIIRWCDGLDLRMRRQEENISTSDSRWNKLVIQHRVARVPSETENGYPSGPYKKSDMEPEEYHRHQYGDMTQIYNYGASIHNFNEPEQQDRFYGQGRWRSSPPPSSPRRAQKSNSRDDASDSTDRDRKIHVVKISLIIFINVILLVKVVEAIRGRVSGGGPQPPTQRPYEMDTYPERESDDNYPTSAISNAGKLENNNNEGGAVEASSLEYDHSFIRKIENDFDKRKEADRRRDWKPDGVI